MSCIRCASNPECLCIYGDGRGRVRVEHAVDPHGVEVEEVHGGPIMDVHGLVHCCLNEKRNMDGGCDNCHDPCL